jgi:hypothetical protein
MLDEHHTARGEHTADETAAWPEHGADQPVRQVCHGLDPRAAIPFGQADQSTMAVE